jgi:Protein of unknown function (DUF4013)
MKTTDPESLAIDLSTPLSIRSSFRFPLQSAASRREVLWGAALIVLLPGIGWLLNMGHRIMVVHRMQRGQPPWPAWRDYGKLLRHGLITAGGMIYYYLPGLIIAYAAWSLRSATLGLGAARFYWARRSRSLVTCLTIADNLIRPKSTIPFGRYAGACKAAPRIGALG